MIGKTISHYKVLEKLSGGGMGVVYKAEDTRLKRFVALKFLPPELTRDEEAKARFVNEAQAASALDHPNICTIYEIDETPDGQTFIAMAFYEGETLKKQVARGKATPVGLQVENVIDIAIQIAQGLAKAHQHGIVHRDIKPGNLIVTTEGVVKIIDFGLAKLAGTQGITKTPLTMGTVAYMSPEQLHGENVDHRTDIWSVGVVLYEMLTGQLPFKGESDPPVIYSILNEDPQPIASLRTDVRIELELIVNKALAKNPEERYQCLDEMLMELKAVKRNMETGTTTERLWTPRTRSKSKPRKMTTILGAAIGVLLLVGSLLMMGRWRSSIDPNRVAVTIFENQTGDVSLDRIGRIVAEWITQGLSQTDWVEAVPTMAVLQSARVVGAESGVLKGMTQLRAFAKETGAGTVVSGAYYLQGDSFRFQAQVTDAKHGKILHTLPPAFGQRDDLMRAIEDVRQRIMGALVMHFGPRKQFDVFSQPPVFEAYQEYITGAELMGSDYPEAIRHFQRSLAIDSTLFASRMFIAVAYGNQGQYAKADSTVRRVNRNRERLTFFERYILDWYISLLQGNLTESLRFLLEAKKLAPKNSIVNNLIGLAALRLNRPQLTVNTYSKMVVYGSVSPAANSWFFETLARAYHLLGNYKKELKEVRRGREHFPDMLTLVAHQVRALAALGQIQEVNKLIDESLIMSSRFGTPGDVMLEAAQELRVHGHFETAQQVANRTIEWYQNRPSELQNQKMLAHALYLAERWEEAKILFEQLAAQDSSNINYLGALGTLAARKGDREEALRISTKLQHIDRPYLFGSHTYWRACIASLLGERQHAVALLQEAFAQGRAYGLYLHRDMDLEPLRDYAPFQELLRPKK